MSDCRFGVSPVNYPDPDPVIEDHMLDWHSCQICYPLEIKILSDPSTTYKIIIKQLFSGLLSSYFNHFNF